MLGFNLAAAPSPQLSGELASPGLFSFVDHSDGLDFEQILFADELFHYDWGFLLIHRLVLSPSGGKAEQAQ